MNKKNNTEEKAQENADRLRKNKRMLRNLRNNILKDYKKGLKKSKGHINTGIRFTKGLFNPKSKVIHYKYKVSTKEATAEHKKTFFRYILHADRYSPKEYIKTNLLILNKTFYNDNEILKILKEVENEVLK